MGSHEKSEINEDLKDTTPKQIMKNLIRLEPTMGSPKMKVPDDCIQILQYINFVKDESLQNELQIIKSKNKSQSPQIQQQKSHRKIPNLINKNLNTISLEEFQKINGNDLKIKGYTQVHFSAQHQKKKVLQMAKRCVDLSYVQKQNKQNYRRQEQKTQIESYYQKLHNFKQCEVEQNQFNQFLRCKTQIEEKFGTKEEQEKIIAEYKKSPTNFNKLGPDQMIKELKLLSNKNNYEQNMLRFKSNLI